MENIYPAWSGKRKDYGLVITHEKYLIPGIYRHGCYLENKEEKLPKVDPPCVYFLTFTDAMSRVPVIPIEESRRIERAKEMSYERVIQESNLIRVNSYYVASVTGRDEMNRAEEIFGIAFLDSSKIGDFLFKSNFFKELSDCCLLPKRRNDEVIFLSLSNILAATIPEQPFQTCLLSQVKFYGVLATGLSLSAPSDRINSSSGTVPTPANATTSPPLTSSSLIVGRDFGSFAEEYNEAEDQTDIYDVDIDDGDEVVFLGTNLGTMDTSRTLDSSSNDSSKGIRELERKDAESPPPLEDTLRRCFPGARPDVANYFYFMDMSGKMKVVKCKQCSLKFLVNDTKTLHEHIAGVSLDINTRNPKHLVQPCTNPDQKLKTSLLNLCTIDNVRVQSSVPKTKVKAKGSTSRNSARVVRRCSGPAVPKGKTIQIAEVMDTVNEDSDLKSESDYSAGDVLTKESTNTAAPVNSSKGDVPANTSTPTPAANFPIPDCWPPVAVEFVCVSSKSTSSHSKIMRCIRCHKELVIASPDDLAEHILGKRLDPKSRKASTDLVYCSKPSESVRSFLVKELGLVEVNWRSKPPNTSEKTNSVQSSSSSAAPVVSNSSTTSQTSSNAEKRGPATQLAKSNSTGTSLPQASSGPTTKYTGKLDTSVAFRHGISETIDHFQYLGRPEGTEGLLHRCNRCNQELLFFDYLDSAEHVIGRRLPDDGFPKDTWPEVIACPNPREKSRLALMKKYGLVEEVANASTAHNKNIPASTPTVSVQTSSASSAPQKESVTKKRKRSKDDSQPKSGKVNENQNKKFPKIIKSEHSASSGSATASAKTPLSAAANFEGDGEIEVVESSVMKRPTMEVIDLLSDSDDESELERKREENRKKRKKMSSIVTPGESPPSSPHLSQSSTNNVIIPVRGLELGEAFKDFLPTIEQLLDKYGITVETVKAASGPSDLVPKYNGRSVFYKENNAQFFALSSMSFDSRKRMSVHWENAGTYWTHHHPNKEHTKECFIIPNFLFFPYSRKLFTLVKNLDFFYFEDFSEHLATNPKLGLPPDELLKCLSTYGWKCKDEGTANCRYYYPAARERLKRLTLGVHEFHSKLALIEYVHRFPYLLQDNVSLPATLVARFGWKTSEVDQIRGVSYEDTWYSWEEARKLFWTYPFLLFRYLYSNEEERDRLMLSLGMPAEYAQLTEEDMLTGEGFSELIFDGMKFRSQRRLNLPPL